MSADPASCMTVRTSAKSRLMRPGRRDQVADALHALAKHVVGDPERVDHRGRAVEHLEQPVVRDHDDGVAGRAQLVDAALGGRAPARALEAERRRDDPDRQRAELAGDPRDDRRRAGPGAAALSRRDEHHVRAAKRILELVERLLGGTPADTRIGARAETLA